MGPQPPTLSDPASGAVQQAAGMLQGLASRYLPSALAAVSAAAGSAQQTAARGFDVPPPPVPPSVFQTAPAPSATAGSRTFAMAKEEVYASSRGEGESEARSRSSGNLDSSRTPSDASLSGNSNLASSFTEIRREEAEGADARPAQPRRTSSSWMSWGSSTPKDKAQ